MQRIHENAGALQTQTPAGRRRYRARLIEGDRWGSSGYYPAEVIERDGPTTWPAGTPVYLDHPGAQENYDRPERSVRDLAGKIASTPAMESDGLYADVEFYPHVAPIIEAMWGDIGMSIRAQAAVESGEAQGRRGQIIKELGEGVSVDVVTKAGAGGKLVSLLESARPSSVTEAMAGDVREWIEKALGPDKSLVDFDEDTAVWRDWSGDGQAFKAQDYALDGSKVTLTGQPREVNREQVFHAVDGEPSTADPEKKPVPPKPTPGDSADAPKTPAAGGDEPTRKTTTPKESETPVSHTISEAERVRLGEAEARAERLETELAEARAENRRVKAETIVAEAFAGIDAPKGRARLIESAATREDFDADAFRAEAQEAAAEYAPAGVRGLGTTSTVNESATEADVLSTMKGA